MHVHVVFYMLYIYMIYVTIASIKIPPREGLFNVALKIPLCVCSGLPGFAKRVHSHIIYVLGWSSGMRQEHKTPADG